MSPTVLDPHTAECFGEFGYGTGYVGGPEWFCERCPQARACWDSLERRVAVADGDIETVERLDFQGEVLAAAWHVSDEQPDGAPDLLASVMLANMQHGTRAVRDKQRQTQRVKSDPLTRALFGARTTRYGN